MKEKEINLFVFHGANAGTKKELIEKDGRVAFEMDVHEEARISSVACNSYMDYESVCGTGNAEIADDTQKRAYLEKIMRHYTDIPFEMLEKALKDNGNPRGSSNDYGEIP